MKSTTPTPDRAAGVAVHTHGVGDEVYIGYHGWSGSHRSMEPLVSYLPRTARLVAFDLPGFGQSAPPKRWSFEDYVAGLDAALDALEVDDATVIGNCAGAILALEQAVRCPGRFRRLVLIDPFAYVPWYFRLLTMPVFGTLFYRLSFANPFGRFVTDVALKSKRTEETNLTEAFHRVDHANAFSYLRMLCSLGSSARYASLDLPVQLLFGERTFSAVRRSVEILSDVWPHAEVAVLLGAGHLPVREATQEVARYAFGGVSRVLAAGGAAGDGSPKPLAQSDAFTVTQARTLR